MSTLWCVHIAGPDDLIPAPSEEDAAKAAAAMNKAHEMTGLPVVASVMQWPYSHAGHTEGLPQFYEYMAEVEMWADYCSYDWVVLCQLFGTMMDLPKGFPMYCNDIQQECRRLGNPELPKQEHDEHNALADARHNKVMWEFLEDLEASRNV